MLVYQRVVERCINRNIMALPAFQIFHCQSQQANLRVSVKFFDSPVELPTCPLKTSPGMLTIYRSYIGGTEPYFSHHLDILR